MVLGDTEDTAFRVIECHPYCHGLYHRRIETTLGPGVTVLLEGGLSTNIWNLSTL